MCLDLPAHIFIAIAGIITPCCLHSQYGWARLIHVSNPVNGIYELYRYPGLTTCARGAVVGSGIIKGTRFPNGQPCQGEESNVCLTCFVVPMYDPYPRISWQVGYSVSDTGGYAGALFSGLLSQADCDPFDKPIANELLTCDQGLYGNIGHGGTVMLSRTRPAPTPVPLTWRPD